MGCAIHLSKACHPDCPVGCPAYDLASCCISGISRADAPMPGQTFPTRAAHDGRAYRTEKTDGCTLMQLAPFFVHIGCSRQSRSNPSRKL